MIDDLLSIFKCGCESVEANAFITSQIEMKNLHLNSKKCHQIHMEKKNEFCPKLKSHTESMLNVSQDKYLGDVISSNGKNEANIQSKVSIGMGAMSNILNIIREVSIGKFYFPIAVLLRQSMFISTILLNSETWVNLTQKNIEDLEKNDHIFLKRIFEAPVTTPTKLLYLESGCYPLKFHIKARKVMYLHYLLNRNENELISRVFWAQKEDPTRKDWYSSVMNDLKDLGLDYLDLDDIKMMKKDKFQKLIKENVLRLQSNFY